MLVICNLRSQLLHHAAAIVLTETTLMKGCILRVYVFLSQIVFAVLEELCRPKNSISSCLCTSRSPSISYALVAVERVLECATQSHTARAERLKLFTPSAFAFNKDVVYRLFDRRLVYTSVELHARGSANNAEHLADAVFGAWANVQISASVRGGRVSFVHVGTLPTFLVGAQRLSAADAAIATRCFNALAATLAAVTRS